jgi:hypothetical protein
VVFCGTERNVRIAGNQVGIRPCCLPKTNLEFYRYINLLGISVIHVDSSCNEVLSGLHNSFPPYLINLIMFSESTNDEAPHVILSILFLRSPYYL